MVYKLVLRLSFYSIALYLSDILFYFQYVDLKIFYFKNRGVNKLFLYLPIHVSGIYKFEHNISSL